jgi:hypothetical protein
MKKEAGMQAIINANMQAGMDESSDWHTEAARQREGDRLAVARKKRQACRQPTGRHEAGGGRQGQIGRHRLPDRKVQACRQREESSGRQPYRHR